MRIVADRESRNCCHVTRAGKFEVSAFKRYVRLNNSHFRDAQLIVNGRKNVDRTPQPLFSLVELVHFEEYDAATQPCPPEDVRTLRFTFADVLRVSQCSEGIVEPSKLPQSVRMFERGISLQCHSVLHPAVLELCRKFPRLRCEGFGIFRLPIVYSTRFEEQSSHHGRCWRRRKKFRPCIRVDVSEFL